MATYEQGSCTVVHFPAAATPPETTGRPPGAAKFTEARAAMGILKEPPAASPPGAPVRQSHD